MKFNHIVCGGTFDHLHKGHKKLLEACFNDGKKISIGITNMAMVRPKRYYNSIESYPVRRNNVLRIAAQNRRAISAIKLKDIYGSTLTDTTIDAIYVTKETLPGAEKINRERTKIGMKPLFIGMVPFALDDDGDKISSERIRQGLISREGTSYYKYLIGKDIHYMPESLRGVLRKPLGRVVPSFSTLLESQVKNMKDSVNNQGYMSHIAVGDIITYNLKKIGLCPSISIIDGITQRKALNKEFIDSILEKDYSNAPNKKGTIQKEAVNALYTIFTSGHTRAIKQLLIQGEEDLLTLVAILFSPLKWHVWYGQSGKGVVEVIVTEKKKQTVYNLLKKFT